MPNPAPVLRNLRSHFHCYFHQFFGGHDLIDQADLLGFGSMTILPVKRNSKALAIPMIFGSQ